MDAKICMTLLIFELITKPEKLTKHKDILKMLRTLAKKNKFAVVSLLYQEQTALPINDRISIKSNKVKDNYD